MKKLSIFMTALLGMGFVACTENFDPEVGPQTNLQESLLKASDVTVNNALPDAINLTDYIDAEASTEKPIIVGTASVKEGAMPANTILKAEVEVSRDADFAESVFIEANSMEETAEISIQPGMLEDAYFNEITKNPNTTQLYMRTIMYTVTGGDAVAIVGKPGENYYAEKTVTFTPLNKLTIAPAYYIVGGPNDWAGSAASRSIKFNHSGEDVYIDPIFTIVFDAAASGDTWFAIGDDQACDAIGAGDWSQLYGIVSGNNEEKEGKLARRTEMGADNSFCVKEGAKKIRVTINMMEQTFTVEAISISDNYYLVGGALDWGASAASKEQKFSHSDKNVFEDPIFTYMFDGNGGTGDIWFAIGDDDACDAIANDNNWSKLLGQTAGNGNNGLTGTLAPRTKISDDGSFKVDGKAKHYRITINMLDMTFEIAELNFEPFIYFIGATDGWSNADQKLALTDEAKGIYTGYIYCADPNGWGNEFKFQKVPGDWGTEINSGHMTGGITGDFGDGGGNFKATAGEGVYFVTLDMGTMTLSAVKVEKMGIIGDFNSWGGDLEMTWNATDYCFEATGATVNANGWKFRINADWGINLGGKTLGNLEANGDNLTAVGTTIKLYPTRKTSDNIYCTVE